MRHTGSNPSIGGSKILRVVEKTLSFRFFWGSGLGSVRAFLRTPEETVDSGRSNSVITAWVFSGVSGFFSVPSHG